MSTDDTRYCPACVDLTAQRDTAWDALREIEAVLREDTQASSRLAAIGTILANGPLDTAPGGPREDECERLRLERDEAICAREIAGKLAADGIVRDRDALRAARKEIATLRDALERIVNAAYYGNRGRIARDALSANTPPVKPEMSRWERKQLDAMNDATTRKETP